MINYFCFFRVLPFRPEGPKWQDCFDTFCARAQKYKARVGDRQRKSGYSGILAKLEKCSCVRADTP